MASILALSGSPSSASRTAAVLEHVATWLHRHGHLVRTVAVRELPAEALLTGNTTDPDIAAVVDAVAGVDGLVIASPVYKAAYTGLLKALLDLLPQFALAEK